MIYYYIYIYIIYVGIRFLLYYTVLVLSVNLRVGTFNYSSVMSLCLNLNLDKLLVGLTYREKNAIMYAANHVQKFVMNSFMSRAASSGCTGGIHYNIIIKIC